MPIKIYSDRIELGDKIITATPTGIRIDDSLTANTQNNRLGSVNFTAREITPTIAGALVDNGFQGTVSGYSNGGGNFDTPVNTIDKFSFTSTANATDVGDLVFLTSRNSGQSSSTNGYSSGNTPGGSPNSQNSIQKYPFTSDTNATDIGDLTLTMWQSAGQSSSTSGYASSSYTGGYVNNINKFPFASDTNATDIGDLTRGSYGSSGQSSTTHGYTTAGQSPPAPPARNGKIIDKFPFASDTNATNVGDLINGGFNVAGHSSAISGYTTFPPSGAISRIEKFPFATDTNSSSVGVLSQGRNHCAGQSSVTSGYTSGGVSPAPSNVNTIDRFPFASDDSATDRGDLTSTRQVNSGSQY